MPEWKSELPNWKGYTLPQLQPKTPPAGVYIDPQTGQGVSWAPTNSQSRPPSGYEYSEPLTQNPRPRPVQTVQSPTYSQASSLAPSQQVPQGGPALQSYAPPPESNFNPMGRSEVLNPQGYKMPYLPPAQTPQESTPKIIKTYPESGDRLKAMKKVSEFQYLNAANVAAAAARSVMLSEKYAPQQPAIEQRAIEVNGLVAQQELLARSYQFSVNAYAKDMNKLNEQIEKRNQYGVQLSKVVKDNPTPKNIDAAEKFNASQETLKQKALDMQTDKYSTLQNQYYYTVTEFDKLESQIKEKAKDVDAYNKIVQENTNLEQIARQNPLAYMQAKESLDRTEKIRQYIEEKTFRAQELKKSIDNPDRYIGSAVVGCIAPVAIAVGATLITSGAGVVTLPGAAALCGVGATSSVAGEFTRSRLLSAGSNELFADIADIGVSTAGFIGGYKLLEKGAEKAGITLTAKAATNVPFAVTEGKVTAGAYDQFVEIAGKSKLAKSKVFIQSKGLFESRPAAKVAEPIESTLETALRGGTFPQAEKTVTREIGQSFVYKPSSKAPKGAMELAVKEPFAGEFEKGATVFGKTTVEALRPAEGGISKLDFVYNLRDMQPATTRATKELIEWVPNASLRIGAQETAFTSFGQSAKETALTGIKKTSQGAVGKATKAYKIVSVETEKGIQYSGQSMEILKAKILGTKYKTATLTGTNKGTIKGFIKPDVVVEEFKPFTKSGSGAGISKGMRGFDTGGGTMQKTVTYEKVEFSSPELQKTVLKGAEKAIESVAKTEEVMGRAGSAGTALTKTVLKTKTLESKMAAPSFSTPPLERMEFAEVAITGKIPKVSTGTFREPNLITEIWEDVEIIRVPVTIPKGEIFQVTDTGLFTGTSKIITPAPALVETPGITEIERIKQPEITRITTSDITVPPGPGEPGFVEVPPPTGLPWEWPEFGPPPPFLRHGKYFKRPGFGPAENKRVKLFVRSNPVRKVLFGEQDVWVTPKSKREYFETLTAQGAFTAFPTREQIRFSKIKTKKGGK